MNNEPEVEPIGLADRGGARGGDLADIPLTPLPPTSDCRELFGAPLPWASDLLPVYAPHMFGW